MSELSLHERRGVDGALSVLCILGAACSLLLLVRDRPLRASALHAGPSIARLTFSTDKVRYRPAGTLVWDEVSSGADLFANDELFVPPGEQASVAFANASTLNVAENSLVVLDEIEALASARLIKGTVSASASEGGLRIRSGTGDVALERGDDAQVQLEGHGLIVDALKGAPNVSTQSGEKVVLAENHSIRVGTAAPPVQKSWGARFDSPSADARLYFQGAPAQVRFHFQAEQPIRIQLSKDRTFGAPIDTLEPVGPQALWTPTREGVYFWRAVGEDGAPQSAVRKLSVLADEPPKALSPRDEEPVSGAHRSVPFSWSHVPGAPRYQLQIAQDASFSRIATTVETRSVGAGVFSALPEGRLFWRVRVLDAARGESPWSNAPSFIYSASELPSAPHLRDPKVEVEHATP